MVSFQAAPGRNDGFWSASKTEIWKRKTQLQKILECQNQQKQNDILGKPVLSTYLKFVLCNKIFFTNQIKTQKLFHKKQLQKQGEKKLTSFFGKLMLMKAQLRIDSANVTSLRMRL
jgi:hypothetical protein